MNEYTSLITEKINAESLMVSDMSTSEILNLINEEDKRVANAIRENLSVIENVVDETVERFRHGGRIIYVGAGSSGRIGIMDAVELYPTYGIDESRVFGIIAGGDAAMRRAIEGAEDSLDLANEDFKAALVGDKDVVIGIAASGRTPYTIEFLRLASTQGALTVSVTSNKNSLMSKVAKYAIDVEVGSEVIQGSTRMKSGTAQKMVLNMISTSTMIKLGRVYGNQMIFVQATNIKLKKRAAKILMDCADINEEDALSLLELTQYRVAEAILMHRLGINFRAAKERLYDANGDIYCALQSGQV